MTDRSPPRSWPMTLEDALGEVRGQGRGHLVEQQDVGLDRERAGQIDDPQRGERQSAREFREVEVREPEVAQRLAEGLDGRLGEAQVGPDIQVRDEGRFLVDGHDAATAGIGGRMGRALLAADGDPARVGLDGPGQDLDERALAGAVRAHERMDLAGTDGQGRRLERDDRAVGLGDTGGLEQKVRADGCHRHPSVTGRWARGMPAGAGIPLEDR